MCCVLAVDVTCHNVTGKKVNATCIFSYSGISSETTQCGFKSFSIENQPTINCSDRTYKCGLFLKKITWFILNPQPGKYTFLLVTECGIKDTTFNVETGNTNCIMAKIVLPYINHFHLWTFLYHSLRSPLHCACVFSEHDDCLKSTYVIWLSRGVSGCKLIWAYTDFVVLTHILNLSCTTEFKMFSMHCW